MTSKILFITAALFVSPNLLASPKALGSSLAAPVVEGPIQGGLRAKPWGTSVEKLAPTKNYVTEEFFFSGVAHKRNALGLTTGESSPYTTRMLVIRPKEDSQFNGSVFVEWSNVTIQTDIPMLWAQFHDEITREGYAYVAVSVQKIGVSDSLLSLKFWDPIRYKNLQHPGDAYVDDIFGQAARALVAGHGASPLGTLKARRILAGGLSQSASLLGAYVNRMQLQHETYDGYVIDGWPTPIRKDIDVPVMMISSETEVEGVTSPKGILEAGSLLTKFGIIPDFAFLQNYPPEEPSADHDHLRVWEIAGAAHFDAMSLSYTISELSQDLTAPANLPFFFKLPALCFYPPNTLYVARPAQAALHQLNRWVKWGLCAPHFPRIARDDKGEILRDENGIAIGGIRMPNVEAPLGVNNGSSCLLFGTYKKFSQDELKKLYPESSKYLKITLRSAAENVSRGSLLKPDADKYVEEASGTQFSW